MTASLGYHNPDELPITLATILTKIVEDELFENTLGILHHQEGIDLIPANIELSGMEVSLVNIMSRELVLKQYIERMRGEYDYILIDCMPSLGMLTINALASVDAVIIPVQAAYLPVKGLEQLIRTIGKVRRQLNKQLKIGGILITMVDNRTNYARDISDLIFDTYGNQIKIFPQSIPFSVRAAEISAEGISIFEHDPKGKVAAAYWQMTGCSQQPAVFLSCPRAGGQRFHHGGPRPPAFSFFRMFHCSESLLQAPGLSSSLLAWFRSFPLRAYCF